MTSTSRTDKKAIRTGCIVLAVLLVIVLLALYGACQLVYNHILAAL